MGLLQVSPDLTAPLQVSPGHRWPLQPSPRHRSQSSPRHRSHRSLVRDMIIWVDCVGTQQEAADVMRRPLILGLAILVGAARDDDALTSLLIVRTLVIHLDRAADRHEPLMKQAAAQHISLDIFTASDGRAEHFRSHVFPSRHSHATCADIIGAIFDSHRRAWQLAAQVPGAHSRAGGGCLAARQLCRAACQSDS